MWVSFKRAGWEGVRESGKRDREGSERESGKREKLRNILSVIKM